MKPCIVVVGLGRSGTSAAKLLNKEGCQVIVIESAQGNPFEERSKELRQLGIEVELGKPLKLNSFNPWLHKLQVVVISPGIPWNHPTLNELRKRQIKVQGEIAIAWERLEHLPWIGITGTNGKTTVTHMLNHVLETNQLKTPLAGNVGKAATEIALQYPRFQREQPDWLVMELSSYQIESAPEISPQIGIWTNLTPDHLERHGTFEAYREIKSSLLRKSKIRILNADDLEISNQREALGDGIWISAEGPGDQDLPATFWINKEGMVQERGCELFHSSVLDMPGKHNLQNLLLVTAAARQLGVTPAGIKESLMSFNSVPHRLESLGHFGGVQVFNDSKATNYDAACIGLKAVTSPTIVLAGGETKRGDATNWLDQLRKSSIGVVLFGSGRNELKLLIKESGFSGEVIVCKSLKKAVEVAIKLCQRTNAQSLLLSPACASFDQYANFEARGNHFKQLITPFLTIRA